MTKTLTFSLLLMLAPPILAQDAFSTIEERMTGKEFTAAGLDKLSAEELAALNQWLREHSVATLDYAREPGGDARGFEYRSAAEADGDTIVSRIVGSFSGWDGKDTLFRLENGMVWKQAESGRFTIPETDQAVAVIESGMFSSWRLHIEGYNKTVRVTRVE